jgi:hypothetical protein
MRPGKTIYLCCQDEDRRGVLSYVLFCQRFRVTTEVSEKTDVALIVDDKQAYAHAVRLGSQYPELPVLVLTDSSARANFDHLSNASTLEDKVPMIELREHLRMAAVRKHGPKPVHVPTQEAVMA